MSEALKLEVQGAALHNVKSVQQGDSDGRSLSYWAEECLVAGAKAIIRSREYAKETRNARGFQQAIKDDPTIVTDATRLAALMLKFQMGGVAVPTVHAPAQAKSA